MAGRNRRRERAIPRDIAADASRARRRDPACLWLPRLLRTHRAGRADRQHLHRPAREACNISLVDVAHPGVPALTYTRLSWVSQNYVRAETIADANELLLKVHVRIPLVEALATGTSRPSTGCAFRVPVRSIHAAGFASRGTSMTLKAASEPFGRALAAGTTSLGVSLSDWAEYRAVGVLKHGSRRLLRPFRFTGSFEGVLRLWGPPEDPSNPSRDPNFAAPSFEFPCHLVLLSLRRIVRRSRAARQDEREGSDRERPRRPVGLGRPAPAVGRRRSPS